MTDATPPVKPRMHHFVQAPVRPLDRDGVVVGVIGTITFAVVTLALLIVRSWLDSHAVVWWLWTGLAGTILGIIGTSYCIRRKVKRQRSD